MAILSNDQYTAIFDKLRECSKWWYILNHLQTSTHAGVNAWGYIRDQLESEFATDILSIATFNTDIDTVHTAIDVFKERLLVYAEAVLEDAGKLLNVATVTTPGDVLDALSIAMTADSKTIRQRTLEIAADDLAADGTIKPHTSNAGNGKLIYTFAQSGSLSTNEIGPEEWVQCEATTVTTNRQETFTLTGRTAQTRSSREDPGSGTGLAVTTALDALLTNGDFETFSGSPSAAGTWSIDTGTWGTEIEEEATTTHNGDKAVEINNNTAAFKISQPVSLTANATYAIGIWLYDADGGATGNLFIEIVDDDKTTQVIATELAFDVSGLSSATWTFKYFTFVAPATVQGDWRLSIRDDGIGLYDLHFDDVQLQQMVQVGGVHLCPMAGSTDFGLNDKFGYGGDARGITIQVAKQTTTTRTASALSSTTDIVFADLGCASEYPVGGYVKHPTTGTVHRITVSNNAGDGGDSDGSDDTIITVTPAATVAWDGTVLTAIKEGLLQRWIGRCWSKQLPSATGASPSFEDPVLALVN